MSLALRSGDAGLYLDETHCADSVETRWEDRQTVTMQSRLRPPGNERAPHKVTDAILPRQANDDQPVIICGWHMDSLPRNGAKTREKGIHPRRVGHCGL